MSLGIILHAALPFVPGTDWIVSGGAQSVVLGYLYHFINAFRMPGFFIIAGYFAALMIDRRGSRDWLRSRLHRLAVPLVFSVIAVVPLVSLASALPAVLDNPSNGTGAYLADAVRQHLHPGFHWVSHLWFVLDLLLYSILFATAYALFGPLIPRGARRLGRLLESWPRLLGSVLIAVLAVYLVVVHVLAHHHLGSAVALFGDYPLWSVFDGPRLAYHAPFFLIGVVLWSHDGLLASFARPSIAAWLAGLLFTLAFVYLRVHAPYRDLLAVALVAPSAILMTRIWMHAAAVVFDRPSRLIRQAVDGSYTVYIVHLPIVIATVALTAQLQLGAYAGFAVATVITSALSIGIHCATRERQLWRYALNGIRLPRDEREIVILNRNTSPGCDLPLAASTKIESDTMQVRPSHTLSVRRSLSLALLQRYLALAASLVTMMIVSRLISPTEMGVYFVAAAFLSMAGPLAQLGVGAYLVQEVELTPARIGTASGLLLLSSWSTASLIFLSRVPVAGFFNEPALADLLTVMAACFVLAPFSTPAVSLLQREMRFDALLVIGVIGSAVQAVTAVTLALRGYSYMSLAWSALAQQVGIFFSVLMLHPLEVLVRPRLSEWRRVTRVGGALTLSTFAAEIGNAAPQLVLGRAVGFEATGLFGRGRTVTDLIWRGLLDGILPVLLPTLAQLNRDGRDLRPAVILTFTHLGAVTWPFFALIGLLALPVLRVLFGPQWDAAAPVLQTLCLIGIGVPITAIIPEMLVASGRSMLEMKLQCALQIGRVALVVALAGYGMLAVAWALVIADALFVVSALIVMRQLIGLRFPTLVRPILQNATVTGGTVLGPLLLWQSLGAELPAIVLLALSAPLAGGGWLSAVYLSDHPLRGELDLMKTNIKEKLSH